MAQTKSALACGGVTHCFCNQGLSTFFLTSSAHIPGLSIRPPANRPTDRPITARSNAFALPGVRYRPGSLTRLPALHPVSDTTDPWVSCGTELPPVLPQQRLHGPGRPSRRCSRSLRQFAHHPNPVLRFPHPLSTKSVRGSGSLRRGVSRYGSDLPDERALQRSDEQRI